MHFVQLYREDINIWKQNPFLRKIEPYKTLAKEDRSGKILLSLFMIYDIKSPMYAKVTNLEERIKDVTETFLSEDFNWDKYQVYVDAYKEDCRTDTQRQMDQLKIDIDEREKFARGLKYANEEERGLKMDLLDSQKTYIKEYKELQAIVAEEVEELAMHGGYLMSYLETLGKELEAKAPKG